MKTFSVESSRSPPQSKAPGNPDVDSMIPDSARYSSATTCKPTSRRQTRVPRNRQDVNDATQSTSEPIEQNDPQGCISTNDLLTSSAKISKPPNLRMRRTRHTSSSADDSGCGDTTPPSTRDSGISSAIKSPLVQVPDPMSAGFQNQQHEKSGLPKIVDVKGSSHTSPRQTGETSSSWGPKRRRAHTVDDEEYSEKGDSICSVTMDFEEGSITNSNPLQNVSEDEARKPEWQPKVVVSKALSDTAFEIQGVATFDKSPLSICSSPSTFSVSSMRSTDEKEAIKIKH